MLFVYLSIVFVVVLFCSFVCRFNGRLLFVYFSIVVFFFVSLFAVLMEEWVVHVGAQALCIYCCCIGGRSSIVLSLSLSLSLSLPFPVSLSLSFNSELSHLLKSSRELGRHSEGFSRQLLSFPIFLADVERRCGLTDISARSQAIHLSWSPAHTGTAGPGRSHSSRS